MLFWILLALLALFLGLGYYVMNLAVKGRRYTKEALAAQLDKPAYREIKETSLASIDWVASHEHEELHVMSYDGKLLHATFLPKEHAKGTILLFHGYKSCWQIDFGLVLPYYYDTLGYSLLLVDQRAHGQSQGKYLTFGVRERHDVATWAAYAAMHFGPAHPLILDGLSMGAATVLMASELELPASVRGIIADCGFSSPYAIMKSVLHWRCPWLVSGPLLALTGVFTRLFGGFGLREVSATEAVAHTKLPILFIHGTGDQFVPCSMSQAAYDACTGEKRLILVEGAGHGQSYLVDRPRVQAAVREFLTDYVLQEAST